MIAKIPNLWPEQLDPGTEVTPRAVLQRQGQVLSERSSGAVRGEVSSRLLGRDYLHTMSIVAPEIDGFHYFVVRVRHNMNSSYPVRVYVSESEEGGIECESEAAFLKTTRDLLHDPRVTGVVHSLLLQVGTTHPPQETV
jgi:hypothetical protein